MTKIKRQKLTNKQKKDQTSFFILLFMACGVTQKNKLNTLHILGAKHKINIVWLKQQNK